MHTHSAHLLVHYQVVNLLTTFLQLMLKKGSRKEKEICQKISLSQFIIRLLDKSSWVFVGSRDAYVLRDEMKEGRMSPLHLHPVLYQRSWHFSLTLDLRSTQKCRRTI